MIFGKINLSGKWGNNITDHLELIVQDICNSISDEKEKNKLKNIIAENILKVSRIIWNEAEKRYDTPEKISDVFDSMGFGNKNFSSYKSFTIPTEQIVDLIKSTMKEEGFYNIKDRFDKASKEWSKAFPNLDGSEKNGGYKPPNNTPRPNTKPPAQKK